MFCDPPFIHLWRAKFISRTNTLRFVKVLCFKTGCVKHSPLAHLAAAARLALISTFDMLLIMAHGEEKKMSCAAKERHFRWLVMVLCQPASLWHTGFLSALIPSIAPGAHKKASVQSIRSHTSSTVEKCLSHRAHAVLWYLICTGFLIAASELWFTDSIHRGTSSTIFIGFDETPVRAENYRLNIQIRLIRF